LRLDLAALQGLNLVPEFKCGGRNAVSRYRLRFSLLFLLIVVTIAASPFARYRQRLERRRAAIRELIDGLAVLDITNDRCYDLRAKAPQRASEQPVRSVHEQFSKTN
jgi:hypothetical protein